MSRRSGRIAISGISRSPVSRRLVGGRKGVRDLNAQQYPSSVRTELGKVEGDRRSRLFDNAQDAQIDNKPGFQGLKCLP
jgi:hypothetical protein